MKTKSFAQFAKRIKRVVWQKKYLKLMEIDAFQINSSTIKFIVSEISDSRGKYNSHRDDKLVMTGNSEVNVCER